MSDSAAQPTDDPPPLELSLVAIAPARQPRLPSLRRGGLSARVAPDLPAVRRPARLHVRAGARGRRRNRAPPVAGPCGKDSPPLAPARGGRVLRHVLLRLGHPLLSGQSAFRPRRSDADAARAGAVLLLA